MQQLGSHWAYFHKIWYENMFRKSVWNIQFWLKPDKNNGYFTWRSIYVNVSSYFADFFLNEKYFREKVVEKIETHILLNNIFFFSKTVPFMRSCGKHIVEQSGSQITIWRMRNACWIPKSTHIHSKYVIFIVFPLQ
jgi:hypothetical protein